MSSWGAPVAVGLPLGRPDNRRYTHRGDRRGLCDNPELMGPDVHGVCWRPVRAYYDGEADSTLVVYEPVHPDEVVL